MLYGRAGACQDFLRLRPYCLTKGAKCAPPHNHEEAVLGAFQTQPNMPTNGNAILDAIVQHNATSSDKYQEVVLDSALNNPTIQGGVNTLNAVVNRTNTVFDDLAQRVNHQLMITPVQTGISTRLANLKFAQYKGVEHYALASNASDMSMIGRAMDLDNLHQSFYVDVTGGISKHDGDKSSVISTGLGYDRIIRDQEGKYVAGILANIGKLSNTANEQSDDGNLYSLTGYLNYERSTTKGLEFLSYLTVGYLSNTRSINPEIRLGEQTFDEKHWMLMSSNALKYNIPLPSGQFEYSLKPMVLADFGILHSQGTNSAYFKREALTDFSADLGLGMEYSAYSPTASYSLQVLAKRNVYHAKDNVGVNLSHANGYIQYELNQDRAVRFDLNALTSQEINKDFTLDLMTGIGVDTEGKKAIQGSFRLHWKL